MRALLSELRETASEFSRDKVPRLGAALAYYTVFSLAPLLLIAIAIGGMAFGAEAARGQIVGELQGLVGEPAGEAIEGAVENASDIGHGALATAVGVLLLLFGASGVFVELRGTLNTIWDVPPAAEKGIGRNVLSFLRERFLSFAMVLGVGFLLLVSLVLSAALQAVVNYAGSLVEAAAIAGEVVNFVLSLALTAFLFGLIYKVLPEAEVAWRDVWTGAIVAAVLFSAGKVLIGLYIGHSSVASAYGAAGSLVVILLWTYFAAQILLFGAELTHVHARRRGAPVRPKDAGTSGAESAREADPVLG